MSLPGNSDENIAATQQSSNASTEESNFNLEEDTNILGRMEQISPDERHGRKSSGQHFATCEEFVKSHGGKRVITKILIANNGIAAVKCIRSIRRWSYEQFSKERAIKFVVMVTPEDLKANAEFIRLADYVCQVKGGSNNNNYANVDLILNIAKRYKVEGVWAGWGHASENPKLPELLGKHGIMFMGPNEHAMWLLGDKIASNIVAQLAGVPTLPWSGSGLVAIRQDSKAGEASVKVPKDLFLQACVHSLEQGIKVSNKIKYPVMIKASEGGGGKGIRKATSDDEFRKAYPQVLLECPGSPVFIMQLASNARHLEVQLFADEEGAAISLFGRDCSIQRRHQKIIEEAPVTVASPDVIREMEQAAVRLAELVGYRSAGTVEYLYDVDSGKYYFLELNPRLQVEHPCTEMVANVNLPAMQLMVAMGIPLHRIRRIRQMNGADPINLNGSNALIDFHNPPTLPRPSGHVIAARITSENPDEGFKPSSGTVHELNFKSNKNVWGYFSVSSSGGLHEFADSQFGHCFSWGEDRKQARENLVVALKELSIRGDFRTIVEHLVMLLEKDEFINNTQSTGWLDHLIAIKERAEKPNTNLALICGAIHIADQTIQSNFHNFKSSLERGQTLPAAPFLKNFVDVELIYENYKYEVRSTKIGPNMFSVEFMNTTKEVEFHRMTDGQLLVLVDRLSYTTHMTETVDGYRVVVGNQTVVFDKENDPTLLTAPSTGKLVKYLIQDGEHLKSGDAYAEMEVMKMITTLHLSESGIVQFSKRPGAVLEKGSLIARLSLDDPSQCKRAQLYTGKGFPETLEEEVSSHQNVALAVTSEDSEHGNRSSQPMPLNRHQGYLNCLKILENSLAGYCMPDEKKFKEHVGKIIKDFIDYLNDPRLPLDEMREVLATMRGRIPNKLERSIMKSLGAYEQNITSVLAQFPAQKINADIMGYLSTVAIKEKDMVELTLQPIMDLCSRYKLGVRGQMKTAVQCLLNKYLAVEKLFQVAHYDKVVSTLVASHKDDVDHVVETVFAHTQYRHRNMLITILLDKLWEKEPRLTKDLKPILREMTNTLVRSQNSTVSLKARTILIASERPSYELRHNHIEKMFLDAINRTATPEMADDVMGIGGFSNGLVHLHKIITDESSVFDVLGDFFYHADPRLRAAALEVYVRRAYTSYEITGLTNLKVPVYENVAGEELKRVGSSSLLRHSFSVVEGHGNPAVKFDFLLPQSHPTRSYSHLAKTHRRSDSDVGSAPTDTSMEGQQFSLTKMMQDYYEQSYDGNCRRLGVITAFDSFNEFVANFESILGLFDEASDSDSDDDWSASGQAIDTDSNQPSGGAAAGGSYDDSYLGDEKRRGSAFGLQEPMNILNVALKVPVGKTDSEISETFANFCRARDNLTHFNDAGIRRITFIVIRPKEFPKYFTYRSRTEFGEDCIYRHLEPALAFQLELNRLKNYNLDPIPVANHKMHLYLAKAKVTGGREVSDFRFFIRSIIRHSDLITSEASFEYLKNEGERLLLESLDELEVAVLTAKQKTDCNHIFMNFAPTVTIDPTKIASDIERNFVIRYAHRLMKLKVKYAEIRMAVRWPPTQKVASNLRLCISNDAGYLLNMHIYKEVTDPHTGILKFITFGKEQGPMHGLPVSTPYMTKDYLETKRGKALALETTFVYDYPDIFKVNIKDTWKDYSTKNNGTENHCKLPKNDADMFSCVELILDNEGKKVVERKRYPGENDIGMVAWKMKFKTPQYPNGREIIVIANDITTNIGSFGPKEDLMFLRASELARKLRIPRIYLSANSGARIGIAKEVMSVFRIAWEESSDPEKGFKYVYLSPDDYLKLSSCGKESVVQTELIEDEGESRYKITSIIGAANDIGVENLSAAGHIAGETSAAYEEVVTISLTTARTIGIGSYLVRLGSRIVQVENSSIILTGFSALNKLLGREVYTSNNQLGGIQIMANNGISHKTEPNDVEGVRRIVKWLSYIPNKKGAKGGVLSMIPKCISTIDPIERTVDYKPVKNRPYDPRLLMNGQNENGSFLPGLFDVGSFDEIMAGWARTVVTGRARLGGIPCGVIAVETRAIELNLPADPANPDSEAKIVSQAGQVWYPDSAYKTAQAIFDFNREELPLVILANWRGFSGGMKDMYEEVLKFGSYIVDALHQYNQPIIIYIPPHGELRGGSWVVVDPKINEACMEMYADPDARGGVLEAEGLVSIKLRLREQREMMNRLDPEMKRLKQQILSSENPEISKTQLKQREEHLAPTYHTVAVHLADLHDTPVRMKEKGVIRDIIPWANARTRLYWRLKRRLLEMRLMKEIDIASNIEKKSENVSLDNAPNSFGKGQKMEMIRRWFIEDKGDNMRFLWDQDQATVEWIEQQIEIEGSTLEDNLKALRHDASVRKFKSLLGEMCPDVLHEAGIHLAQELKEASKLGEYADVIKALCDDPNADKSKFLKKSFAINPKYDDDFKDSSVSTESSENGES